MNEPTKTTSAICPGSPSSSKRTRSGRTLIRLPPRSSTFEMPTKPATNSVSGRS